MDYETLNEMWVNDSDIDSNNLTDEVRNVPKLHSKYFSLLIEQNMRLKRLESKKISLVSDKYDYYSGSMDIEDVKERGWKPMQKLVLKGDIQRYVDSDPDVIELNLKIAYVKSILDYLESIIKMISNRSYNLKLIFDYTRFREGG